MLPNGRLHEGAPEGDARGLVPLDGHLVGPALESDTKCSRARASEGEPAVDGGGQAQESVMALAQVGPLVAEDGLKLVRSKGGDHAG